MMPPPTTDARYNRVSREQVARCARIYSSNIEAGAALGILPGSFGKACRTYGIETPHVRRQRERRAARRGRAA